MATHEKNNRYDILMQNDRVYWVRPTEEGQNGGKLNKFEIINKLEIFWIYWIRIFTSYTDLQKVDFLSECKGCWLLLTH